MRTRTTDLAALFDQLPLLVTASDRVRRNLYANAAARRAFGRGEEISKRRFRAMSEAGRIEGFVGTVEDVTEAHLAQERLRELYERTPAMMHSIDNDGIILTVSDRWLEKMGYQRREEVIGRRALSLFDADSRPARERELAQLWDTGRNISRVHRMLRREQRKRAEVERRAAELNALLAERSEMLDVLAHEVRQPLNNASAALQIAAAALADPASRAHAAERLRRAQARRRRRPRRAAGGGHRRHAAARAHARARRARHRHAHRLDGPRPDAPGTAQPAVQCAAPLAAATVGDAAHR
jgi:PAS domain S-box-containing protein